MKVIRVVDAIFGKAKCRISRRFEVVGIKIRVLEV
jgi:hypothetical protein